MSFVRQQHVSFNSTGGRIFANVKYFGISILIVSLLVQVLSSSFIVLNYEVNQSYIIEQFCENTDKPELKCDGKCHLAKQIKEDTDQKSEAPAALSEIVTFVMTTHEVRTYEFNFADSEINLFNGLYLEGNYSNSLESLFRPPQV